MKYSAGITSYISADPLCIVTADKAICWLGYMTKIKILVIL